MINIDFTKWMCEKAEGFKCFPDFSYLSIDSPEGFRYSIPEVKASKILYPLLLQRAIEGVNYDLEIYCITIMPYDIKVTNTTVKIDPVMFHMNYGEIDKTKESALKYIYEQEKRQ